MVKATLPDGTVIDIDIPDISGIYNNGLPGGGGGGGAGTGVSTHKKSTKWYILGVFAAAVIAALVFAL